MLKMSNYEKWESGDRLLLNDKRKGTLFSKPKYRSTNTHGLFFADIKWEDGEYSKDFMVCITNLRNLSQDGKVKVTKIICKVWGIVNNNRVETCTYYWGDKIAGSCFDCKHYKCDYKEE